MTSTTSTSSSTHVPVRNAKHLLPGLGLSILVALVTAYFFTDIFATINEQVTAVTDLTRINKEQDEAIADVQKETRKAIAELPKQQESIRDQLASLEDAIEPIRSQLQQMEAASVTQQIDNDRQLAHAMELRNLGQEITSIIKRAEKELTSFEGQKRDTETGAIGKNIAADADLLDLYATVAEPNISSARLVHWLHEVELRLTTVRTIDENSNVQLRIDRDAIRELEVIRNQAIEVYEQLRAKQATIREIVARAANRTATDDNVSLAVVLKEREQRRAFEIESAAHQRAQELADQQAEKLAQAREETVQRRTKAALAFEDKLKGLIDEMSQSDKLALADAADTIRNESEQRHQRVLAELDQQRKKSAYQAALPEIRAVSCALHQQRQHTTSPATRAV